MLEIENCNERNQETLNRRETYSLIEIFNIVKMSVISKLNTLLICPSCKNQRALVTKTHSIIWNKLTTH